MAKLKQIRVRSGLYIGLMSGTSVDGIDAALVRLHGAADALKATVLAHHQQSWPASLRMRLLAVMAPARVPVAEICDLNMLTAREFAGAANKLLKKAGVKRQNIIAIGSHGQTVCHLPPVTRRDVGSTLQIGDNTVIATLTGIVTVGNFRCADMAVGGQGAPLVPLVDKLLLTHNQRTRCVQNLGGIGNVTFLPPRNSNENVIAFDTGPGNMLIDALTTLSTGGKLPFDPNGRLAAAGQVHPRMLRQLQDFAYFQLPPPKTTGRELFGEPLARKLRKDFRTVRCADLLATATELTAWSIAESYRKFLPRMPQEVILCGGGVENRFLMSRIAAWLGLQGCHRISTIADYGVLNQSKEALAFAVLAALTLQHLPGNLPTATGAQMPAVLGSISDPTISRRRVRAVKP